MSNSEFHPGNTPAALTSAKTPQEILVGGGEMGDLTRSFDWATTSLGPVAGWPQSLRTTVNMLLSARHPMLLFWGPELIQFYNSGFRPSLGADKHPKALGQRARECWADAWPIVGSQIEAVMQRGESTWNEDFLIPIDRNDRREEVYWTYGYSPIWDERGEVNGVLVVVNETTGRVVGERRLRTLGDLAAGTSDARTAEEACVAAAQLLADNPNDVPFALLYLLDGDGRHASLASSAHLAPETPASPAQVDLAGRPADLPDRWLLGTAVQTGRAQHVQDLGARFGPLPGTPWPEPCEEALVLPIARQGQDKPVGLLVAGISPRRPFDAEYVRFLELVADRIATAVADARAYEAERRRAEALAELDRAKTTFFSNISHEFRTPLTLMLGPVEEALLDQDEPLPPRQHDRLEIVRRNATRLLKLVNALLDFSRITAGQVQASYEPTDLAALTADLASMFRSLIERAGLRLVVDTPPLDEPVYVDRAMWEKVVLNLLSNAFKFTLEGEIAVSLRRQGESVALEVRDTGTGIPAAEVPQLFKRFHRVEGAEGRTYEGSGIGLALVQELVKLHGGEVRVESEEGRGSTFTVSIPTGRTHLPAAQIGAGQEPVATALRAGPYVEEALAWLPSNGLTEAGSALPFKAHDAPHPSPRGAERACILLADDNADMRNYVSRLLSPAYDLVVVADGAAALEAARQTPPDLILADVMMPRRSGFELIQSLQGEPNLRKIPVLLLSARAGEEARIEGLQAGAAGYITKPFSARELIAHVGAALEIARVRREAEARLTRVFMQAPVAVSVVSGPDFVYELANPLYLEMIGRSDITGKPIRDAFPELPHDAPVFQMLEHVYESGEPFTAHEYCVPLDRSGSGIVEDVFFMFTCQPVRDAQEEIRAIVTVAVDVTDQVQARHRTEALYGEVKRLNETLEQRVSERTAELERANVSLSRSNRELQDFAYVASHDLQEPLRKISTFTDLLRLEYDQALDETAHDYMHRMQDAALRMRGLLRDLLTFSRVATQGEAFRRVDLNTILSDVLSDLEVSIAEPGGNVEAEPLPSIEADPMQMRQLFQNLIGNALKFHRAAVPPVVRIYALEEAPAAGGEQAVCRIVVEDNGIGFEEKYLDRIFVPFQRLHDRSTFAGTGMGLAICRRIAERHEGSITARSEPGKGTRFIVTLPRKQAGSADVASRTGGEETPDASLPG